jgi:hypothetical protein
MSNKKKMSSNVVVTWIIIENILGCYTGRGSTGGRCHFCDQQGGVQRLNSYHHLSQVCTNSHVRNLQS